MAGNANELSGLIPYLPFHTIGILNGDVKEVFFSGGLIMSDGALYHMS